MSESSVSCLTVSIPKFSPDTARAVLRPILYQNETHRLSPTCQNIQILSGTAWVTIAGEDVILTQGEKASILPTKDVIVVSAVGAIPLVLEIQER
jgi:hypothetical protein